MLEIIKKGLIVLSVIVNVVLGILYARVEAQFSMYKQFVPISSSTIPVIPMMK